MPSRASAVRLVNLVIPTPSLLITTHINPRPGAQLTDAVSDELDCGDTNHHHDHRGQGRVQPVKLVRQGDDATGDRDSRGRGAKQPPR